MKKIYFVFKQKLYEIIKFALLSYKELYNVYWPELNETIRITLLVVVFILFISMITYIVDIFMDFLLSYINY